MRRAILRLRRLNWRWTLAFTRKPPGERMVEGVMYLDCPPKPGGFRVFQSSTSLALRLVEDYSNVSRYYRNGAEIMATGPGVNQGKTAFLEELLPGNKDADLDAINRAWKSS